MALTSKERNRNHYLKVRGTPGFKARKAEIARNWRKRNAEHCRAYKRQRWGKIKDKVNKANRTASPEVKARKLAMRRAWRAKNYERARVAERRGWEKNHLKFN